MTITKALLGRMVDDVGARRTVEALDTCWDSAVLGDDLGKVIADCVSRGTLTFSEPSRGKGATADYLRRLLDGGRVRQSKDHVLLLRAFVLSLSDLLGTEPIAHAIVKVSKKPTLTLTWDSGWIGGNGSMDIHKVGGKYWCCDDYCGEVSPPFPFPSLRKAIEGSGLTVTDATASVSAKALTPTKVASMLSVDSDTAPGHQVSLNGKAWVVDDRRELKPLKLTAEKQ